MTEPLKFLDKIPIWAPPTEALAKASKASLPKDADPKKYAVKLLVGAIELAIAEPLEGMLVEHIDRVLDEFKVSDGPEPSDPVDLEIWEAGLFEATVKALAGDTVDVIGADALNAWFNSQSPAESLAAHVFQELMENPAILLHHAGITVKHIETLVARLDPPEQVVTAPAARPAPPAQPAPTGRRRRAASVQQSSMTKAVQLAMETLIGPGAKEADIAAVLGVSRPQALNYRTGKTLFHPTPTQMEALKPLFDAAIARLTGAWQVLEETSFQ